jgi:hypothetical protein
MQGLLQLVHLRGAPIHPDLRDLAHLHVGELVLVVEGNLLIPKQKHHLNGAFQHQHVDFTVEGGMGWKADGFQLVLALLLDHIHQISHVHLPNRVGERVV